jgi:hypothetical protein
MTTHARILFDHNDELAFGPMEALPHVSAVVSVLAAQSGSSASFDRVKGEVAAELHRRRIRRQAPGQEVY